MTWFSVSFSFKAKILALARGRTFDLDRSLKSGKYFGLGRRQNVQVEDNITRWDLGRGQYCSHSKKAQHSALPINVGDMSYDSTCIVACIGGWVTDVANNAVLC